jgi:choline dehydrogenase
MLSGVGPAEHLKEYGIPVLHDLPGVGSRLVDHPQIDTYFKDRLKNSLKFMRPKNISDILRLISAIYRYRIFREGPLASNVRMKDN